jgi:hypothetical protein
MAPTDLFAALFLYDRTGNQSILYTNGQKVVATHSDGALAGNFGFGGYSGGAGGVGPASMDVTWAAAWSGAAAEMTEANVYALFTALGIEPVWAVPFDGPAPNYIKVPTTATHFTRLVVAAPLSVWGFQESSGNLLDTIGTGFTLTSAGSPNHTQGIADWIRFGVLYDNSSTDGHGAAAGVGPDPSTTSVMWMFFADVATSGAGQVRTIMSQGGAAAGSQLTLQSRDTAGSVNIRGKLMAATVDGVDDVKPGVSIVPYIVQYDRTNSKALVYSLTEKLTLTYDAGVTDGSKGVGGNGIVTTVGLIATWGCVWTGADAEITTAQVKTLLQAFGYAPTWTP